MAIMDNQSNQEKKFFEVRFLSELLKHRTNLTLVIGVCCLVCSALATNFLSKKEEPQKQLNSVPENADTFIPEGYNLVPIQLINAEAIGSIISDFAVVDLYSSSADSAKSSRCVAKNIKLLRAPLNPEHFAILIPDRNTASLFSKGDAFYAVLRNQKDKTAGSMQIDKKQPNGISVQYYSENLK
jgi:hypothetical protein